MRFLIVPWSPSVGISTTSLTPLTISQIYRAGLSHIPTLPPPGRMVITPRIAIYPNSVRLFPSTQCGRASMSHLVRLYHHCYIGRRLEPIDGVTRDTGQSSHYAIFEGILLFSFARILAKLGRSPCRFRRARLSLVLQPNKVQNSAPCRPSELLPEIGKKLLKSIRFPSAD